LSRRVLVTGASGFVGANLARRLLADGHDVHLLLRPKHKPWRLESIAKDVTIHQVDLADRDSVAKAMAASKPDWVFHLAAHGAYPTQKDVDQMIETNVRGTANLLQAASSAGVEAFVNAGTSSEYGYKDHAPDEDERVEPNSDYAVTKAAATMFCRHTATRTGLPVTTLRLYSVYGPYEEPSRLVPTLIVQGLEGRLPPLVNPDIARDYIYVDDACEAFVLAAATADQDPGVVYNVGSGVQTTLRDIVAAARRILGVKAEPVWGSMPERSWDTNVWVSNPSRIKARLGWSARHDLESGLTATAGWFKLHPDHLNRYRVARSSPVETKGS
jgi:dolichol-phosphate mannosyltransferase